jgi:hypothetical protein
VGIGAALGRCGLLVAGARGGRNSIDLSRRGPKRNCRLTTVRVEAAGNSFTGKAESGANVAYTKEREEIRWTRTEDLLAKGEMIGDLRGSSAFDGIRHRDSQIKG